jgi:hypothetical protein
LNVNCKYKMKRLKAKTGSRIVLLLRKQKIKKQSLALAGSNNTLDKIL